MAAYSELRVYQMSMDLVEDVYSISARFPREEVYGLTSQMRRAAISIPSNIAEGYGREKPGYIAQFLRIALGSTRELETQLKLAVRVNFVSDAVSQPARTKCDDVDRMLRGLVKSVEAETTND
jgi:four helix bundle protein